MSSTHVILNLLGDIALLLWGIRFVHGGVLNAFGMPLRRVLGTHLDNRLAALLAGTLVTAALQSSTATAMMIGSFTATGLVSLVPALAVMLGANLGTALIVQVLSFDISLVFPLLIFGGYLLQRRRAVRSTEIGRIAFGLGLMLLSLHLLGDTMRPVETQPTVREVVSLIVQDPAMAFALAGLFAWAAHSSVAAVLLVLSLSTAGVLTPESTVAMVLGANLGSALNPVLEGTNGEPARLRVPLGNLANRIVGCIVLLPFLHGVAELMARVGLGGARLAPNLHLVFNVVTALGAIGFLPWIARALNSTLPDRVSKDDPGTPRYLDERAVDAPAVGLANAAREVLRMADIVETMLEGSESVLLNGDAGRVLDVRRTDDVVDKLYVAVRRYLAALSRQDLSERDIQRLGEILDFAVNLEHIGDIVDTNLMQIASQRIAKRLSFAEPTMNKIADMHQRLIRHLKLAVSVLMDGDTASARQLVAEKEEFRELERSANEFQFRQILSGHVEGFETASHYLDVVRDLKRIESHIAATVHPLLKRKGELRQSRLA